MKSIAMKLEGVALIIGGWGLSGFPFCKVGTYDKLPDIIDSLVRLFGLNQYLLLQCFTETERVGYLVVLKLSGQRLQQIWWCDKGQGKTGESKRSVYSNNRAGKYALLLVPIAYTILWSV